MPADPLAPLLRFYAAAQLSFPHAQSLDPEDVPQPAHRLLVHEVDMTSTLETYFGRPIHLNVLNKTEEAGRVRREVILCLEGNDQPVEFGAIEIRFNGLPAEAQAKVLRGLQPLGGILSEFGVDYSSRPGSFFQVESDALMARCFRMRAPARLYGRCNTLSYPSGDTLAEVVEILPPLEQLQHAAR